jgi:hemolysin activation/secretion protein
LVVWLAPPGGAAQEIGPPALDLPGKERPELPEFEPEDRPVLPPVPEAPETREPLADGLAIFVREIRIVGNSVLPDELVAERAAPYVNRRLTTEDLEVLRRELTLLYVDAGYATSGATLPDQDLAGGVLVVRIVEGRIERVEIEGARHFRESWLTRHLLPDHEEVVYLPRLEERLQLLQLDRRVRAIRAELRPGPRVGRAVLKVAIREAPPLYLRGDASNDRAPAIGGVNGRLRAEWSNAVGVSDVAAIETTLSAGLGEVRASYEIPFTPWDTLFAARVRYSASQVVEEPLAELDIESDFTSVGFQLSQPVHHTPRLFVDVGLIGEWRRAKNTLGGFPIDFTPGFENGKLVVSVLRLLGVASWRGRDHALAARTTLNFGVPVLGSTSSDGVDSQFVSWLAQLRWARRFGSWGTELVGRFDVQVASEPMPTTELFALGGYYSVRGYRENRFVRDNGFAFSTELRVPLWKSVDGRPLVQLAPFLDWGRSWFASGRELDPGGQWLAGIGVGLRVNPTRWLRGEVYWGAPLVDVLTPGSDLQDHGVYFRIAAMGP